MGFLLYENVEVSELEWGDEIRFDYAGHNWPISDGTFIMVQSDNKVRTLHPGSTIGRFDIDKISNLQREKR